MRTEILRLLAGEKINQVPSFNGLIHVTAAGLKQEKLSFPEIHLDAQKMSRAAASTFRLTGLPSATLPLDLCVEAEALGSDIDFREHADHEFPHPSRPRFSSTKDIVIPTDALSRARLPIVQEAISLLKKDLGEQVVISGMIPGPFTLLTLIAEPATLFTQMKRDPEVVNQALFHLSAFMARVGHAYRLAGADFITIHEMGGSPGFLGPERFETFVLPALRDLIANLPKPRMLSICGNTNNAMGSLAQLEAEAISVDQTNDLAASRLALPNTLLFGNIDPVETLYRGNPDQVREAVARAKQAGVDAVWPGCDLVPQTPIENLKAMLE